MRYSKISLAAGMLCIGIAAFAGPAAASPLGVQLGGLAQSADTRAGVVEVRWRHHHHHGYGAALAAGAALGLLGGIVAAQPRYYYYEPAPVYVAPPYDSADAYCFRRFKSYDPYSGTYLGYDGYRHPCP